MHPNLANGRIKSVRLRNSQGDCPTEPALSVEQLEDLAMHFADLASAAAGKWEYQSADGTWQPCRNAADAATWAVDGTKIREA